MRLPARPVRRLRTVLAAPFVWWAREASAKAPSEQTAWERGKADAIMAAKDGRLFGLFATVTTCAAPMAVGFATTKLPIGFQLALIVVAAVFGYLLVPSLWAVAAAIAAPYRQRDAARAELLGRPQGDDAQLGLVDRLEVQLKHGRGFLGELQNLTVDPLVVERARAWHDGIHRLLIEGGRRDLAQRWLNDTPSIPASFNLLTVLSCKQALTTQVECLEGIIGELGPGKAQIVQALTKIMDDGALMLEQWNSPDPQGEAIDGRQSAIEWEEHAKGEIARLISPTERVLFAEARGTEPNRGVDDVLRAKIEYIRDQLLPKAREGHWN
jgi:hypothetical protein